MTEPSEAPGDVERAFEAWFANEVRPIVGGHAEEYAAGVMKARPTWNTHRQQRFEDFRAGFAASAASPVDDESPGDVIHAYADGTIVLDDGITTHSYRRACAHLAQENEQLRSDLSFLRPDR